MTDASGTFNPAGRRAFLKIFHMRLWLFQTIWRSNHGVDACNATSVDVVFAKARGFWFRPESRFGFFPAASHQLHHPKRNYCVRFGCHNIKGSNIRGPPRVTGRMIRNCFGSLRQLDRQSERAIGRKVGDHVCSASQNRRPQNRGSLRRPGCGRSFVRLLVLEHSQAIACRTFTPWLRP